MKGEWNNKTKRYEIEGKRVSKNDVNVGLYCKCGGFIKCLPVRNDRVVGYSQSFTKKRNTYECVLCGESK